MVFNYIHRVYRDALSGHRIDWASFPTVPGGLGARVAIFMY